LIGYRTVLAGLILLSACSSGRDEPTGPTQDNLSVRFSISGDFTTAPPTMDLYIDGKPFAPVSTKGETRLTVSRGVHVVSLAPDTPTESHWCRPIGQSSFSEPFAPNTLRTVVFNVDCLSLLGTGVVDITLYGSGFFTLGGGTPRIPVGFARLNGLPWTETIMVSANETTRASLPAGLYSVTLTRLPFCELPVSAMVIAIRGDRGSGPAVVATSYLCK
jgi:hypothetical protein